MKTGSRTAARRAARAETAPEALHRLLGGQFDIIRRNEPRTAKGSVKGLHDIRVALRRMRTLCVTFAPLDPRFLAALDKRASKVCDRMGDARDIDVWIGLFRELEAAGGLEELSIRDRRRVLAELREARTRLTAEALACGAYRRVKTMLRERLKRKSAFRRPDAPAVETLAARRMLVVRELIAKRYRNVGSFSSKPAHDLRRSGRRMRYLAEFFAPSIGAATERAGRWITRAQAALGKMHDCDNALELSRDLPTSAGRAAVRRGLKKRRVEQLRTFKSAWRRYDSPRLQDAWRRQLERHAQLDP